MSCRIAVEQRSYTAGMGDTQGPWVDRFFTVWNLLKYSKIKNAHNHKVRKKTFVLYYVAVIFTLLRDRTDTRLCEPLWLIRLNCQLMTKLEMMPVLQAQVCGCVSAHPGLPPGGGSKEGRLGRSPCKTYDSRFTYHDFIRFGKQRSRFKAILPSIVCQSSVVMYTSSLLQ